MRNGFTLIELLVAVMITAILVSMAVPMYERTIEKSRIAEARTMLKRLYDAKMRLLDEMEEDDYQTRLFGLENLDYNLSCTNPQMANGHKIKCRTRNFVYSINPVAGETDFRNGVCAYRHSGPNQGVAFLYQPGATAHTARFLCYDHTNGSQCEAFGLSKTLNDPPCGDNLL